MKKLICCILLLCFSVMLPTDVTAQTDRETPAEITENDDQKIFKNNFKGMEKAYQGPLPWENNDQFQAALAELPGAKLMAAHKVLLPEPTEGEESNIALAVKKLAGTVVKPGETFSYNNTVGPFTEYHGFQKGSGFVGNRIVTMTGGGVCKVASVLYNAVTFCDLPIIMHSTHSMTVPYVPPGQDATVCYGAKDLRFLNNTEKPILIWSQKVDNALYVGLYGYKEPPEVIWHHKIIKEIDYWTITRINPNLKAGEQKVVRPGSKGLIVKSWVTVKTADGKVKIKDKGKSWYNACPEIIEKGQ